MESSGAVHALSWFWTVWLKTSRVDRLVRDLSRVLITDFESWSVKVHLSTSCKCDQSLSTHLMVPDHIVWRTKLFIRNYWCNRAPFEERRTLDMPFPRNSSPFPSLFGESLCLWTLDMFWATAAGRCMVLKSVPLGWTWGQRWGWQKSSF